MIQGLQFINILDFECCKHRISMEFKLDDDGDLSSIFKAPASSQTPGHFLSGSSATGLNLSVSPCAAGLHGKQTCIRASRSHFRASLFSFILPLPDKPQIHKFKMLQF
ncbi:hypothetical protein XENORESO_021073 [Xenotaenia resolanae]|uniref:Uncharacterized protein n=1 Tax=Xenotaenia resolanae TaxID=208358 RepID=A0ABV0WSF5_9TELE